MLRRCKMGRRVGGKREHIIGPAWETRVAFLLMVLRVDLYSENFYLLTI
jgi:hypothetical protein